MNIVISIHHPAWAHQFRSIIRQLQQNGHHVKVFAVKKDNNLFLLDYFGISYELLAESTGNGVLEKAWLFASITLKTIWKLLAFKPDVFIGRASPMMAIAAFCYRKPHVIFEDTEHSKISLFFCKRLSTCILTPLSFRTNLGKDQKRVPLYKESFYLHPDVFNPKPEILNEIGLTPSETFTVMRFVSWSADHDLGKTGLTFETKVEAVNRFLKYGKVFISSEVPLPAELEPYRIRLSFEKIHHVLYYATLYYGESATMASECAMLGTHAVFSDFAGRGYTDEQETKYSLVSNFKLDPASQQASVNKGEALLQTHHLWQSGKEKRTAMLQDVQNGSALFLNELTGYLNKE